MGKPQKLREAWDEKVPKEAMLQDVLTFLNHYFASMWSQGRTSHIVIRCEALKKHPDYKPNGEITVPIKGGQKVKGFYIKELLKALQLLETGDEP